MMANKLWGGRFDKAADGEMYSFLSAENAALDAALIKYDIEGSLAHVCMLAKQRILSKQEASAILSALSKVKSGAASGKFTLDPKLEDVHTNVESAVTKLTPHGKKMHTARSRNDQIALDTLLYMRDAIIELTDSLLEYQASLKSLSTAKTSEAGTFTNCAKAPSKSEAIQMLSIDPKPHGRMQGRTRTRRPT